MDEHRLAPDGPVDIEVGPGESDPSGGGEKILELPDLLPILPVKDMSIFPRMVLPMLLADQRHQRLIDDVLSGNSLVGLVALKEGYTADTVDTLQGVFDVGVVAMVLKMAKIDGEGVRLVAQGTTRFQIMEIVKVQPYLLARVIALEDIPSDDMESMALVSNLRGLFTKVIDLAPHLPEELMAMASSIDDPGALSDLITSAMNISPEERQTIVEALEIKERLRLITNLINREIQVLELGSKIQNQVKEGLDKTQRDFYLRQQLKAIKEELGENAEEGLGEAAELLKKIKEKHLPQEVRKEAERELGRMEQMHSSSSEYHVITTYLDWILHTPWLETTEDHLDIAEARRILDADHYGMAKVKKRILEYLSVRKLNPDMKGPIICFVGPPGVGKTSLGRSIARAMGRKFQRISLGGVRDEAEIRGHRRTYVGAMPGRVIQSLRRAGTKNPVFMLDEVDKIGMDFRGDPASALLEVLDPEQNNTFTDHYLDLPMDLSRVVFITTANVLDTIPPALKDRMEILELPGYTAEEKLKIATKYLLPRQRKEHGLKARELKIGTTALKLLISSYTREAGVRNLEREIGALCRAAARQIAEGEAATVKIKAEEAREIMGPERIMPETALRCSVPGVATGLAWTPAGGDILFIEATSMPGKGLLTLTGQLGDVMKESATAAVSYVRANAEEYGVDPEFNQHKDLHVHIPAGAIPKDGPSAGVTMFTSLLSLLSGRTVKPEVAMTGEITLRGRILPVGGIKEKVLAGHRAGIRKIILPAANKRELEDVPPKVKKKLKFVFADTVDDVVRHALVSGAEAKRQAAQRDAVKKKPVRKTRGKKAAALKDLDGQAKKSQRKGRKESSSHAA